MVDKIDEHDAYSLIQSLGNYLKTDIEVSSGIIERKVRGTDVGSRVSKESEGHNVKVTISNTAPIESNYPMVVFTGVGLLVQFPQSLHRSIQRMKNQNNLSVDLTNAPQVNPFQKGNAERVDGLEYPNLTSDERKHGHTLFPGQSIKYNLSILSKECPNLDDLKLWVEGTISRRHLYHVSREVRIKNV